MTKSMRVVAAEEMPEAATAEATAGGESKGSGNASGSTGTSTKAKGVSRTPSDMVDTAADRLIDLLKKLETETAIAAVAVIVRRFGDANWLPAAERKKAA